MAKKSFTAAPHLAHQTNTSRGEPINMTNRKPFRSKAQKEAARKDAVRCKDGAYRSTVPVQYHTRPASN